MSRLVLAALGLAIASMGAARAIAEPPPNLVFILADDAGVDDLGAYGGTKIRTPHLDRLAREGIRFTRHYAGSTVCAPSRSVLMTGLHTGHARVRGNGGMVLQDEDVTLAEVLRAQGYATGLVGKWGLGGRWGPGAPWLQGFDFFFGYLDQVAAHRYYPPFLWRGDQKVEYPDNPEQRSAYSHDVLTEEALGFVERHRDEPFFLYIAYTIPHADLDVPGDSMAPYREHFGAEPPFEPSWWWGHYRAQPTPRAAYAGMVSRLDRDVGRLLDRLAALGLDRRTLVVFSSDNGRAIEGGSPAAFFAGPLGLRGHKRDLYEGGIRAPLLARWPERIAPGRQSDLISGFQDWMPTFAEAAGAAAPAEIDGVSLLPTLLGEGEGEGERQREHPYLYWESQEWGGKQAVRRGRWKLVRQKQLCTPVIAGVVRRCFFTGVELYDLEVDPGESNDLAGQRPDRVAELVALLDRAHTPSPAFPLPFYAE